MTAADGFAARAALFYAALLVVTSIQVPFFPLWLNAKGLDPALIGFVIAAPMIVRVFAAPIITRVADRSGALRGVLIVTSAATAVMFVAMANVDGFWAIFLIVALAGFAFAPIGSLADAYTLEGLRPRGGAYGPVRLWGSVAFMAGTLGTGATLKFVAADNVIWLIVAALVAMTFAAFALRPLDTPAKSAGAPAAAPRQMLLSPQFLAIVLGAGFIQASHAIYYGFSALDWTQKGLGTTTVGTLWALGVLAEVVLFAVSGRLPAWITPIALLGFGAAGATLRWIAMAFDPPHLLLPLLQCLHALSFRATHLGSVQFVAHAASGRQAASAQGDFAIVQALVGAGVTAGAGVLYGALGDHSYALMAVAAGIGGLLIYGGYRVRRAD